MDGLFIIGIILYLILSYSGNQAKKKQQEAQRKARAETMAMGEGGDPAPAAPVGTPRTTRRRMPFPVEARPAEASAQPVSAPEKLYPPKRLAGAPAMEGPSSRVESQLTDNMESQLSDDLKSQLTQITSSSTHAVEASSISGHYHQESSLSGDFGDCGPESPVRRGIDDARAAGPAASSVFLWNQNAVRSGLIYAEILGKPKALRGR